MADFASKYIHPIKRKNGKNVDKGHSYRKTSFHRRRHSHRRKHQFHSFYKANYVVGYHFGIMTAPDTKSKVREYHKIPYINTTQLYCFRIMKNTKGFKNIKPNVIAKVKTKRGIRNLVIVLKVHSNKPSEIKKTKKMQPVLRVSNQKLYNKTKYHYYYIRFVRKKIRKLVRVYKLLKKNKH